MSQKVIEGAPDCKLQYACAATADQCFSEVGNAAIIGALLVFVGFSIIILICGLIQKVMIKRMERNAISDETEVLSWGQPLSNKAQSVCSVEVLD